MFRIIHAIRFIQNDLQAATTKHAISFFKKNAKYYLTKHTKQNHVLQTTTSNNSNSLRTQFTKLFYKQNPKHCVQFSDLKN